MRIPSTILRSTLALAGVLLGAAPAAQAQRLVAATGDPIPYRVDVPAGARIEHEGYFMTAETDNVYVLAAAVDLVAEADHQLPVSDGEARRIMTGMFLGSDSLLMGLLQEGMRRRDVRLEDAVMEIRTLGGQRAGYLRGRIGRPKDAPWLEAYVTVKDGIMYMLMFTAIRPNDRFQTLASQVHGSFILPDAPPAAGSPTKSSGVLRRTGRSR